MLSKGQGAAVAGGDPLQVCLARGARLQRGASIGAERCGAVQAGIAACAASGGVVCVCSVAVVAVVALVAVVAVVAGGGGAHCQMLRSSCIRSGLSM